MAGLRVFVSSTCYDLSVVRSQLRTFIQNLGHEPIMSDYSDILYNPLTHTHTSCIDEVISADVVVLIVGSRYGGKSVPEAVGKVDLEQLSKESSSVDSLKKKDNISITQLEVLKAIENQIPVYAFIDINVWHDHALYEKNKDNEIFDKIIFPSIEKSDTAKYIFEFINFLRHRTKGNSVYPFTRIQDIEDNLKRQWSAYFQKLLNEQRLSIIERKRIDKLTDQFEDLKTAILTTMGTTNDREIARGVVRFRQLLDFIKALRPRSLDFIKADNFSWNELLNFLDIKEIISSDDISGQQDILHNMRMRSRVFLIKSDNTFFEVRYSIDYIDQMSLEWDAFVQLPLASREVIVEALADMRPSNNLIRYYKRDFQYFLEQQIYSEKIRIKHIDEEEVG